jgi:hypothetical protein
MLAVLVGLREWLHPASYLALGTVGLVSAAVYALAYLALTRGKVEQVFFWRSAAGLLAWTRGRLQRAPKPAPHD